MKTSALVILLIAFSGNAMATLNPTAAKLELYKYGEAAAHASSMAELKAHWSTRFSRENDALYAQQVAPLPPATRSLVEKRLIQAIATTVNEALPSIEVTCTNESCTARAKLAGGVTQSYTLVDERRSMLVDSADRVVADQ